MAISQRAGATATAAAVRSTTGVFNCQTGDVIVLAVAVRPTTASVVAVTDTIGNSYIASQMIVVSNTGGRMEEWWVISSGTNASNTVTISPTGNTVQYTVCAESYSGVGSVGRTATSTGSNVTPTITLTTQDANNWVAIAGAASGNRSWSATAPSIVRQTQISAGGATSISGAEGDAGAFAVAGSNTVTLTLSQSNTWATGGIELRVPAAVVAPTGVPRLMLLQVGGPVG